MIPNPHTGDEHQAQSGTPETNEHPTHSASANQSSPDYGEDSYRGHGRLAGQRALIAGGASGIGKAAAIAFLREGSDVALSYHNRDEQDAQEIKQIGREAWKRCLLLPGDVYREDFCGEAIDQTITNLGALDTLVINVDAARDYESLADSSHETILEMFSSTLASLLNSQDPRPFFEPGSSIIIAASLHPASVSPDGFDYELAKSAITGFTRGLASELSPLKVRVNAVIPTAPRGSDPNTGQPPPKTNVGDSAADNITQPVDLAGAYVYLASREAENVTGATLTVPRGEGRMLR